MNNTFKNSIVGALAIFGLVTFLSSAISSPTVVHEGSNTPESHVWEMHTAYRGNYLQRIYTINKKTGEVRKYSSKGMNNGNLKDQYYQVMREDQ